MIAAQSFGVGFVCIFLILFELCVSGKKEEERKKKEEEERKKKKKNKIKIFAFDFVDCEEN